MKIRNISAKLIGIAGQVLLPDAERDFPSKAVNAPVRALEKAGLLVIIDDTPASAKKAPKAKAAVVEDAAPAVADPVIAAPVEEAPAEEAPIEKPIRKRTTTKKKEEAIPE